MPCIDNDLYIGFLLFDSLCDLVVKFLATDPEVRVRFPRSGSGTGSIQPSDYNWLYGIHWADHATPSIRKKVGANFTDKRWSLTR
jgi:hypothetical protein